MLVANNNHTSQVAEKYCMMLDAKQAEQNWSQSIRHTTQREVKQYKAKLTVKQYIAQCKAKQLKTDRDANSMLLNAK